MGEVGHVPVDRAQLPVPLAQLHRLEADAGRHDGGLVRRHEHTFPGGQHPETGRQSGGPRLRRRRRRYPTGCVPRAAEVGSTTEVDARPLADSPSCHRQTGARRRNLKRRQAAGIAAVSGRQNGAVRHDPRGTSKGGSAAPRPAAWACGRSRARRSPPARHQSRRHREQRCHRPPRSRLCSVAANSTASRPRCSDGAHAAARCNVNGQSGSTRTTRQTRPAGVSTKVPQQVHSVIGIAAVVVPIGGPGRDERASRSVTFGADAAEAAHASQSVATHRRPPS